MSSAANLATGQHCSVDRTGYVHDPVSFEGLYLIFGDLIGGRAHLLLPPAQRGFSI